MGYLEGWLSRRRVSLLSLPHSLRSLLHTNQHTFFYHPPVCALDSVPNVRPSRSPKDVTDRLDRLIDDIRSRWHAPAMDKSGDHSAKGDVLVVAHGHILRAFAMRWAGYALSDGPTFLLEAGGVGTLR